MILVSFLYHHSKTILLSTLGKQLFLSAYIKKNCMQKLATAQIRKIRIGYVLKSADVLTLDSRRHTHAHLRIPHTPARTSTHPLTPAHAHVHVCLHPHPPTYHGSTYMNVHLHTHVHTHAHPHAPHTYPLMPLT